MTHAIRSATWAAVLLVIFVVVEAKIHNGDPAWIVNTLRPAWVWAVDVTQQIAAPVQ
ncbi:MAG TPA: hypothetical protein VGH54_16740 [Mycobacterium sp.]|jgi:hypothetical protein|uniref:hypothetical protein n=1 Tax=Mycobacterium sp. TaxID=1785 RepID=UPI002F42ECE3